jgi:serine/threonine-protein kinase HipA
VIDPEALHVWYEQQLVGYLWRDKTSRIGFRYNENWLNKEGFAISVSLPLALEEYSSENAIAHHFFANLLPEGNAREQIVTDLKIANSDFELLRAIGGECAGALSILPDDREPSGKSAYEELSEGEFQNLIKSKGNVYTRAHHKDEDDQTEFPRLSLAGAQNKCPVLVRDNKVFIPRGEAPSTHIIKFTVPDYRHVPAFEAVLTNLARQIGLNTVDIEFKKLEIEKQEHHYLVVSRYDRQVNKNGIITRLHQEDFCQALGISRDRKYEQHNGVSFADCYHILQKTSIEPVKDVLQLLKWQSFNYLAGNSDGHAKNLSLLYEKNNNIRLAPFYDLVCTRAIDRIDQNLAFAIGGQRTPGNIQFTHWQDEAESLGIRKTYLQNLVHETANQIQSSLRGVVDEFQQQHGDYAALQRVVQVIEQQCKRILESKK